jgi:hypothetical protein
MSKTTLYKFEFKKPNLVNNIIEKVNKKLYIVLQKESLYIDDHSLQSIEIVRVKRSRKSVSKKLELSDTMLSLNFNQIGNISNPDSIKLNGGFRNICNININNYRYVNQ